ncbi:glutathione S-transferase family protein [Phenylobacterium sp.]|jgi:glutathione S-transferase/RNA polymerase-associated protein|uniref:glutathione S-transferase family protein n=1 Tax=Phenylobacterium sp. TaxID=1871053 RepID=UPI002F42130F
MTTPASPGSGVTLYDHPLSPYAQKVRIALREKAVPFRSLLPSGVGSGAAEPDFSAASPRGEVPALIDGAVRVFDSTIILEYIEDKWPTPPLMPATPGERAKARMLEEVMDTHYEAINWGLGEIRFFKRAEGSIAARLEAAAAKQTRGFFSWLEVQLDRREWFNGERFGWGDLAVIPYLNGSASHGFRPDRQSALEAWRRRANARPSVRETGLEAAGAIGAMRDAATRLSGGTMRREYRDHRLEWMIKSGGLEVVAEGLLQDNIRFGPDFS